MNEKTPTQHVAEWLAVLGAALERGDDEGAAELFGADSYWRDLVSFTWNVFTAEGNAEVRRMIEQAVIPAKPSAWQLDGEASKSGGVMEGWIRFETAVARGYGHLRLIGGMLSAASRAHVKAAIEHVAQEFEDLAHRDARLPLADKDGCTALFAFRQWEFSEFTRLRRR